MARDQFHHRQQVFAKAASAFFAVHLAIMLLHDLAHRNLGVELTTWQAVFVYAIIVWAPLIAVLLMWTRVARAGAALLAVSMAGALLFGAFFHFVYESPDHIGHLPPGELQGLFVVTSVLLVLTEALGVALGGFAWVQLNAALRPAPAV